MPPLFLALAQLAPALLQFVGKPGAAEVAKRAVEVAQAVTGTDTPESALDALKSNPDAVLAYQKAILEQQSEFARLAVRQEEIAAADRGSAREREAKVGDSTTRNLAYLIVGSFVGMCFAVLYDVAKVDSVLAGTIIGYLSAKAEQVASYYFGSSSSSRSKDETIGRMAGR